MSEREREREREREYEEEKCVCHGVCESELVGVRNCVCVCPLGALRQNRLECADPTETHREGETRGGQGEKNGKNERKMQGSRWEKKSRGREERRRKT